MDQNRLRELVIYDPETGVFTTRLGSHQRPAGAVIGISNGQGRLLLFLDGRKYYAHRMAWLYTHGWCPTIIDHADGDPLNNRLENLRQASRSQNRANSGANRGRTLPKGVYRSGSRFQAQVRVRGRLIALGSFSTATEASSAYQAAAREHFGEFARAA